MYCPQCRADLPDDAKYCTKCSYDFTRITTPPSKKQSQDSLDGMGTSFGGDIDNDSFKVGTLFANRYEVMTEGHKGGMGAVYKCRDTKLNEIVALKVIHPRLLSSTEALSRFRQEVSISRKLQHANIVRVFNLEESEGKEYFTMEWVEGKTLRDVIIKRKRENSPFTLSEANKIIGQLADALSNAHKHTIHRDIKPENILVTDEKDFKIKLGDFGIAKMLSPSQFTSTSMQMGTPYYMAPEQKVDAGNIDKRADIYALGVVLFELLTLENTIGFELPSEINKELPSTIDNIIKKAVATKPVDRYADAKDLAEALKKVVDRSFELAEKSQKESQEKERNREEKELLKEEAERKQKEADQKKIEEEKVRQAKEKEEERSRIAEAENKRAKDVVLVSEKKGAGKMIVVGIGVVALLVIMGWMLMGGKKDATQQVGQMNGEVVARIDGEMITVKDVEKELSALPAFAKEFFKSQEGITKLIDELVKKDLLYVEAKRMGIDKEEPFRSKPEGESKKNALITRLLEVRNTTTQVTDKEVEDYYNSHKDEFVLPEAVRVSQIVIRTEDDSKKVYQRLQNGEPFNRLATEVSIDQRSASSGGDIGMFKRGEMNTELEKVAFRLKKNQISMPVPLGDGIHILVVTDIKGAARDFNSAKGGLRNQLAAQKQQEGLERFIDGLRKTHTVEVYKENFAKIKNP